MPNSNLSQYLDQISGDLKNADNKQEELEYLVEIGKVLIKDKSLLTDENYRVKGCASNTYVSLIIETGQTKLLAHTDSYVVAGYLKIIQTGLTGLNLAETKSAIELINKFAMDQKLNISHIPSRMDAFSRIMELITKQYNQTNS